MSTGPSMASTWRASLGVHVSRTITNDYTFQYNNWRYQIEAGDIDPAKRRDKITIQERVDGSIKAYFNGKYVHFYTTERMKVR
jgi:hypothetical protein